MQNTMVISKADLDSSKVLQIVHMSSHWVACQLFLSEVHFYDSAYSTVSADTLDVLAQLANLYRSEHVHSEGYEPSQNLYDMVNGANLFETVSATHFEELNFIIHVSVHFSVPHAYAWVSDMSIHSYMIVYS